MFIITRALSARPFASAILNKTKLIPSIQPPHLLFHRPPGPFGGFHFLVAEFPGGAGAEATVIEGAHAVDPDAAVISPVIIITVGAQYVGPGQAHLQAFVQKVLAEAKVEVLIAPDPDRAPPYPVAVPPVGEVHGDAPGQLEIVLHPGRPGGLAEVNFGTFQVALVGAAAPVEEGGEFPELRNRQRVAGRNAVPGGPLHVAGDDDVAVVARNFKNGGEKVLGHTVLVGDGQLLPERISGLVVHDVIGPQERVALPGRQLAQGLLDRKSVV